MKKSVFTLILITLACLALVSCASASSAKSEAAPVTEATVTSLEELVVAAKTVAANGTITLANDVTWNSVYTGSAPLEVRFSKKGITFDLGGHTIEGVATGALRFFGDFTIQNGKITGLGDSYVLLINSVNSTSGIDYSEATRENHKVNVNNLTLVEGGIRAELSTIKINDCDVQNSGQSGNSNCLYFVGCWATVTGGKLNQTAETVDTISRTNCVYCSGTSTIQLSGIVLEGTKRLNAYKNTVAYKVTDCGDYVTTTPEVV